MLMLILKIVIGIILLWFIISMIYGTLNHFWPKRFPFDNDAEKVHPHPENVIPKPQPAQPPLTAIPQTPVAQAAALAKQQREAADNAITQEVEKNLRNLEKLIRDFHTIVAPFCITPVIATLEKRLPEIIRVTPVKESKFVVGSGVEFTCTLTGNEKLKTLHDPEMVQFLKSHGVDLSAISTKAIWGRLSSASQEKARDLDNRAKILQGRFLISTQKEMLDALCEMAKRNNITMVRCVLKASFLVSEDDCVDQSEVEWHLSW